MHSTKSTHHPQAKSLYNTLQDMSHSFTYWHFSIVSWVALRDRRWGPPWVDGTGMVWPLLWASARDSQWLLQWGKRWGGVWAPRWALRGRERGAPSHSLSDTMTHLYFLNPCWGLQWGIWSGGVYWETACRR